jgi:hypothetical protein
MAALIIENAFTSAFGIVIPFPILLLDKFNNVDKIEKVK